MSHRASRGNAAEVVELADLSADAAAQWEARRAETLVENAERRQRREGCLRDSALVGAGCGAIGGPLGWKLMSRYPVGPMLTAFAGFVGFFMPYMYVSNVLRYRCQSAGLQKPEVPKSHAPRD